MIDKNSRKKYKQEVSKFTNNQYYDAIHSIDPEYNEYLKENFDVSYDDFKL